MAVAIAIEGWLLALVAARLRAKRGRYRDGLTALLSGVLLSLPFEVLRHVNWIQDPSIRLAVSAGCVVAEFIIMFLAMKWVFGLSVGRTFGPFAMALAWTAFQVSLALVVVKPYVLEAFVQTSVGMAPTILPRDQISVVKFVRPRRWDIVPYRTNNANHEIFLKRLVGLPGDRLRFQGTTLFINDAPTNLPAALVGRLSVAPNPGPWRYRDGETITLGNDECFLLGDNVPYSADSRIFGPIPLSSLVGVADLTYWPLSRVKIYR